MTAGDLTLALRNDRVGRRCKAYVVAHRIGPLKLYFSERCRKVGGHAGDCSAYCSRCGVHHYQPRPLAVAVPV